MSSTLRAQFWLLLPTRMISPLRTYQTVPSMSRSRVTRSPTASTVPVASPASTTSPTPYWSSKIMKMPDRKSLTRLCAPKPMATPAMPALARIGPMSTNSLRIIVPTTATTTALMMLLNRLPMVRARCTRRVGSVLSWVRRSGSTPSSARRVSRSTGAEQQPAGHQAQHDQEDDGQRPPDHESAHGPPRHVVPGHGRQYGGRPGGFRGGAIRTVAVLGAKPLSWRRDHQELPRPRRLARPRPRRAGAGRPAARRPRVGRAGGMERSRPGQRPGRR